MLVLRCGDVEPNPGPSTNCKTDICIMHSNACSLRNKLDLFEAECNNYDIITISETWLNPGIEDKDISLPNFYPPVRLDRNGDPHGGVAIYVRNSLQCKPRPDLQVPLLEAVWIETKLDQTPLLVGSFYRPPNANVNYWQLLTESIRKANNDFKRFIILGDFNTDWLNNPSKHLTDTLNLYNLHQLVRLPTRITNTSSSCIDLIITQSPDIIKKTDVAPPFCSDHSTPYVYVNQESKRNTSFERMIFNYDKLDKEKFIALLNDVDWNNILTNSPIDESCNLLTTILMETAKKCMPSKIVKIRPRDASWMNIDTRRMLKKRNEIHKEAKRTNTQANWHRFRQYRNLVIESIKTRKKDYFEELNELVCRPDKFGTKQWWKLVNTFLNKKGMHTEEIPPILHNGILYYTNKEKADIFNSHFVQQSTLDNPDSALPQINFSNNEIQMIHITAREVKEEISKLNLNKATGPDKIHNRLLLAANDIISTPLSEFFNRCLTLGKFPDSWKLANVTPIYKKGNKDECSNYRPISLLSCVGKLFERCVHKHVYSFIINNNILTPAQSGFRTGDSTINQLLSIYNNLCINYDQSVTTQSIFFDISKAFDRVWHRGLIHKLNSIGIRGQLLVWFTNYLADRKQVVVIGGESSNARYVPAGVPQGSVLGPLLFLIYINDIVCNIDSVMKLFADDTSLSYTHSNPTYRAIILNSDLIKIDEWSKTWKVTFNDSKTELMNLHRDNLPIVDLYFSQTLLEESPHHKHLGIILQNNCKWNEHVNYIIKKVMPLLNCLKSLKFSLLRKPLEIMYKSFILPIFDYADIVWDNCTAGESQQLENLHLEALRTITGLVKGTSHEKIYNESGFCSLKQRRERHKLIMYHKLVHQPSPQYLTEILPPLVTETNPYHRRRPLERSIPRHRTEIYRTSFFPSTSHLWNSLPERIQQTTSISAFKYFLSKNDAKIPNYYYRGSRTEQVLHCRLRNNMSNLNHDLFNRHLIENPSCRCGHPQETAEHFLLHCPLYTRIRTDTIAKLNQTIHTLLHGDPVLTLDNNTDIFSTVHTFISMSKRFD